MRRARVVETQQQLERRALARAGRADEGNRLARLDREVECCERLRIRPRRVAESDVVEAYLAAPGHGQRHGPLGGDDRGIAFFSSTSRSIAPAARCTSPQHLRERRRRDRDVHRVDQELAELPAGHLAAHDRVRAGPEHESDRAEQQIVAIAVSVERIFVRCTAAWKRVLDRRAEAPLVHAFERERLHGLYRVQRLVGDAARVGDASCDVRESLRTRRRARSAHDHDRYHTTIITVTAGLVIAASRAAGERDRRAQRDRRFNSDDRLHQRRVRGQAATALRRSA